MTLYELRKFAKPLGVKIESDRDDYGWGYWLTKDDGSGCGIWPDENFCADREEVYSKLQSYRAELA
jgi:hypothetical protein